MNARSTVTIGSSADAMLALRPGYHDAVSVTRLGDAARYCTPYDCSACETTDADAFASCRMGACRPATMDSAAGSSVSSPCFEALSSGTSLTNFGKYARGRRVGLISMHPA